MDLSKMSREEMLQSSGKYLHALIGNFVSDLFEQRLPEIEDRIRQLYTSDFFSRLEDITAHKILLEQKNVDLEKELKNLHNELSSGKKTCQYLNEQNKQQEEQINRLQTEVTAQQAQQQGYRRSLEMNISKLLPFIDTRSYESYVYSLYNEAHIALIYDNMKKDFEDGIPAHKDCYEHLIDDYIEISRRICGKESVRRQKVNLNDLYETALFDKTRKSREIGQITRIIYRGLEKDGLLLGTCKALVEVG